MYLIWSFISKTNQLCPSQDGLENVVCLYLEFMYCFVSWDHVLFCILSSCIVLYIEFMYRVVSWVYVLFCILSSCIVLYLEFMYRSVSWVHALFCILSSCIVLYIESMYCIKQRWLTQYVIVYCFIAPKTLLNCINPLTYNKKAYHYNMVPVDTISFVNKLFFLYILSFKVAFLFRIN